MRGLTSVESGRHYSAEQMVRLLMWGFGVSGSDRNHRLVSGCLSLFEHLTLDNNDLVLSKNVNRHVWLIISGNCIGTLGKQSLIFQPGEWIGFDPKMFPNDLIIRVSSAQATFLRIRERDFKERLPGNITQNMDRRIRGLANRHQTVFRNALRISQSILPEIRDPIGGMRSARVLPIKDINRYVDADNVHVECEKERSKLRKLTLTAR